MDKLYLVALALPFLGQHTVQALRSGEPVLGDIPKTTATGASHSLFDLETKDHVLTSQQQFSSQRSLQQLQDSITHARHAFLTRTLSQETNAHEPVEGAADKAAGNDGGVGAAEEEAVPEIGSIQKIGHLVNDPELEALPIADDSSEEENVPPLLPERTETSVLIGIMSDVSGAPEQVLDAVDRRESARRSWLKALNNYPDIQARFVVGPPHVTRPDTAGVDYEPAIKNLYGLLEDEQKTFPDQFLSVDVEDCETCGARKYLAFLAAAAQQFEAKYFLRISDTTLVAPKNLALAAQQWTDINAAYTGCMASPQQRWNEARKRPVELPQNTDRDIIGSQYPAFAHLDAFAVAGSVAEVALVPNQHNLRQLEHEDTSVGLWMLGLRVNFFNDTRLCASPCASGTQPQKPPSRRLSQAFLDDNHGNHNTHRSLSQDPDPQLGQRAGGNVEFMPHLHHGPVPHNPRAFVCTVARAPENPIENAADKSDDTADKSDDYHA